MSASAQRDPAAPDARAANLAIAALRLALVPIALVALSNRQRDLGVDLYPYLVVALAIYGLAMLALGLRRDRTPPAPLAQALVDLVLIAALVYTSGGATSPLRFAFYVLPIIAALRLSPMLTAGWTGLALVAYLMVTIPHPGSRLPADTKLIVEESLTLIWVGAAAVMVSTLVGRRARRFAALATSRRELVRQLLGAEARERHRLAQVLHDGAIQNVLLARQEVTDLQRGVTDAGERAKGALDETHQQLRDEVFAMHPVGLERAGSAAVLQHFGDEAARRGRFTARVRVEPAAAQTHDALLFASAREILTNAAKHAHATHVDVALGADNGSLRLRISDDGVGFGPERLGQALAGGHIGLAAIGERIRAVGGDLVIDSEQGRGTTITATIPSLPLTPR